MKRSRSRMILALSFATLMAAAGAATALWSLAGRDQAQGALDLARDSRQRIEARLQAVRDEEAALTRARSRIAELDRLGALGAGPRPEWTQKINRIQNTLNLDGFTHEFSPPAHHSTPGLCATALKLKTRLRHEGEFLRLITALQAGAIVQPRRCALQRDSDQTPALSADCDLDWLTLDLTSAPQKKGSSSR